MKKGRRPCTLVLESSLYLKVSKLWGQATAFPKGALFIRLRDELGPLLLDQDFTQVYSGRGRPAMAPWRLALITIMQFVENLSDRQAADAVRGHLVDDHRLGLI